MKWTKSKFQLLFILGLIARISPAHADDGSFWGSLGDSLSDAWTNVSTNVRNQINQMYGVSSPSPSPRPTLAPAPIPISTPSPSPTPTGPNLTQCQKFLEDMYEISDFSDPKQAATVVLNGVLDFMSLDIEGKISDEELAARNKCVELALDAGADPNSNGQKADDDIMRDIPLPLARAINDNDEFAVKALLAHKANPNANDTSLGKPIPLLRSALYYASQDIAVELINAGADITIPDLLWTAAGNAADKVVDVLIQSKKIPVNEVDRFTDFPGDEGETALDASERGVYALKGYQKKFPAGSSASLQDKIVEVNHILYYTYPIKPQLKMPAAGAQPAVDPDAFIGDLLVRQQKISDFLRAAGWTCKEDNCGIIDLDVNVTDSGTQNN